MSNNNDEFKTNEELKKFITETMLSVGFRISLKGFEQFRESIICYIQNRNQKMADIYKAVAEKSDIHYSCIERNLRKSISDVPQILPRISSLFNFKMPLELTNNKDIIAVFAHYILTNFKL